MYAVITCLRDDHDLRLVLLAAAICLVSAFAAFGSHRRAGEAGRGPIWRLAPGLVAGMGVWATHFLAMLAYQPMLEIGYDTGLTLASLAVSLAGMAAAFVVAGQRGGQVWPLVGGAIAGLSIATMHFIGISAVRLRADIEWDVVLVVAACIISVAGAALAFFVDSGRGRRWRLGPIVMVLAICGLHFTAMGAVILRPDATLNLPADIISRTALAAATAASAIFILAAALALQMVERIAQRATLESLSGALDSAPSAIAFFDADQKLVFWNAPYARLMEPYGVDLRRGLEMAELGRALSRTEALVRWAGGAPLTPETLRRMRDSGTFVNSAGSAFRMDLGSPPGGGVVVVIHDVTDQHQAAETLVRARDAAEAASRAKSEFLANMSHEVRTPLNAVLGMAQIMSRHPLDEDQKDRLSVIRESGATLLALLDDVLDISKIEAGRLGLDVRDFDLCARLGSACAPFAVEAEAKGLRFELHVDPSLGGDWRGDGARIAQVVSNLASNAVKFTDAGEVAVIAEPAEGGVRITVRDTGIGMNEDQLAHLYEAFSQGDASSTRRFGGVGLGLAMAWRLAGLMGAGLSAQSRPKEGSVFVLDLPLTRAPQASAVTPDTPADTMEEERPMRILAAEDNATNRRVLGALMEPLGVELTLAGDGVEAVEAYSAGTFDLVLMDIQMPRMNGVEATRAIREIERQQGGRRTPIVAVTANVMSHQVEEYLAAGMDAVVPKPLQAEALLQAILRAAQPPSLVAA